MREFILVFASFFAGLVGGILIYHTVEVKSMVVPRLQAVNENISFIVTFPPNAESVTITVDGGEINNVKMQLPGGKYETTYYEKR
jgi:hypothetical protein